MSSPNDFLAIRPRKQRCLSGSSSSRRASMRTQHPRTCSSTSLPPYGHSWEADLLDSLSDSTLDSDLDQGSASSATLLSQSDLSARLPESHRSYFLYPLHEPGQMTAHRTRRLRARIASVIMSIPATCEDVVDVDEDESRKVVEAPPETQASKLRRISCVRDLRRAFRDGGHGPAHFPSVSLLELPKASYELGILAPSIPPPFNLTPRSSLCTLVDLGNTLPKSTSDLKTLCGSTLSSMSVASRFATKVHSIFSPARLSHTCLPNDTSQLTYPRKYSVLQSSIPRPQYRRVSLQHDARPAGSPGEAVWSCAKISQSTFKLAARRGHPPRRVFSNPIAGLSS